MNKLPKLYLQSVGAILFAFITSSFILFHAPALQATEVFIQNPSVEQQKIGQLTAELNRLIRQYRSASTDELALIEQQLNSIATERQQLLAEVVESDPQTVIKYALPEKVKAQFPEQVQEKFESWVHAQGELEIYFEDHKEIKNSRLRFYLKQDEQRFPLSVVGSKLPIETSGYRVYLQGVLISKGQEAVIATNDEQIILAAGDSVESTVTSNQSVLNNTLGEQKTAVIMVNFQDKPTEKPWTADYINDRFFNGISQYFLENSFQQTWLTGDVLGWYTIPLYSTGCNYIGIGDHADAAAQADNIDLTQYERIVYIFPKNACSWGGIATVGGSSQTRAWINNAVDSHIPAHELGHNFGLYHSHGMNCEGDATETNCSVLEYGDTLDTMGGASGHYNSFQKERLGWLNQGQMPPIQVISQSGSYAVEAYELQSSNTKALKVYRDVNSSTGENRWFFIEMRKAIGEDQFIASDPYLDAENITNGVIIHLGTDKMADSSYLLDMTIDSDLSFTFADMYDPALESGSTFTDPVTGLSITNEYIDNQTATVYVSYDVAPQSTCNRDMPVIEVSPVQSQWVSAGSQVDFSVNVTNQDSSGCGSSTFDINAAEPASWSTTNSTLVLLPGETKTATISVTSATDAADDFYDIPVTALNTDDISYSGTTSITYVVSNESSNNAPNAQNDSVSMASIDPIVINVMANDSDPDADNIYVSGVTNGAKGTVSINADGTVVYSPAKRFKDSDSFTYTISDGQASDTASVSLTLQASSSDGGGNTKGGGKGDGKGGGKPSN